MGGHLHFLQIHIYQQQKLWLMRYKCAWIPFRKNNTKRTTIFYSSLNHVNVIFCLDTFHPAWFTKKILSKCYNLMTMIVILWHKFINHLLPNTSFHYFTLYHLIGQPPLGSPTLFLWPLIYNMKFLYERYNISLKWW